MKNSKEMLEEHYANKYSEQSFADLVPIRITDSPRDRFEAAVRSIGRGERYLEIAPGDGRVMSAVKERFTELRGIEISRPRVDDLNKFFAGEPSIQIAYGDVENKDLPYPAEHFDWIVMVALIEHLIEPISTLQYLHGLMRPGGKMLIDTPNIAKWTRRIKLASGRFPSTASLDEGLLMYDRTSRTDLYDEGHLHYFTFRSLSRLLTERIGFRSVEWVGYGTPYVLCSNLPTLFSEIQIIATK